MQELANSGEITGVQLDTALRDVHASPPQRPNAECRKSQVPESICERGRIVTSYSAMRFPLHDAGDWVVVVQATRRLWPNDYGKSKSVTSISSFRLINKQCFMHILFFHIVFKE